MINLQKLEEDLGDLKLDETYELLDTMYKTCKISFS